MWAAAALVTEMRKWHRMSFLDIRHGARITVHVKFICQIQTESYSGFFIWLSIVRSTQRGVRLCVKYMESLVHRFKTRGLSNEITEICLHNCFRNFQYIQF